MRSFECNPEKWVESLSDVSKFDLDRQKEHPIFTILGRGYDMLREEDRLLFMDVVLFHPVTFGDKYKLVTLCEWLHMVHGPVSDMASIMKRLQGLKARALLEDIGIGGGRVIVHDLYREFARFEANRGKLEDRSVMWHAGRQAITLDLEKTPPGGSDGCWSNVERVGVVSKDKDQSLNVEGVKWQHFANVVVLLLQKIKMNQELDLRGLRRLRSLTLEGSDITVIGLGELRNFRWLDLEGICCGHRVEIGHLTELQVLEVSTECWRRWSDVEYLEECKCVRGESQPLELANLDKCINLRDLEVRCACLKALPDLSEMIALRRAVFVCPNATDGPVLGSQMGALQHLELVDCKSLRCLPRLGEAVSLQLLVITVGRNTNINVEQFPEIPVIKSLPQVRQLPDMVKLTKLRRIELVHMFERLAEQPRWFGLLPSQLRYFTDSCDCLDCTRGADLDHKATGELRYLYEIFLCGVVLYAELPQYGWEFVDLWELPDRSESAILRRLSQSVGWFIP